MGNRRSIYWLAFSPLGNASYDEFPISLLRLNPNVALSILPPHTVVVVSIDFTFRSNANTTTTTTRTIKNNNKNNGRKNEVTMQDTRKTLLKRSRETKSTFGVRQWNVANWVWFDTSSLKIAWRFLGISTRICRVNAFEQNRFRWQQTEIYSCNEEFNKASQKVAQTIFFLC